MATIPVEIGVLLSRTCVTYRYIGIAMEKEQRVTHNERAGINTHGIVTVGLGPSGHRVTFHWRVRTYLSKAPTSNDLVKAAPTANIL